MGARRTPTDSIQCCLMMVRKLDIWSEYSGLKSHFVLVSWSQQLNHHLHKIWSNLQQTLVGTFYRLLYKDLPHKVKLHLTKTLVRSVYSLIKCSCCNEQRMNGLSCTAMLQWFTKGPRYNGMSRGAGMEETQRPLLKSCLFCGSDASVSLTSFGKLTCYVDILN